MGESVGDKISAKAALSRVGARRSDFKTPKSKLALQTKVINQAAKDTGLKASVIRSKKGKAIMNAINQRAIGQVGAI